MKDERASSNLAESVAAALEQRKPWMLSSLAGMFNVTEKQAAQVLPEACAPLPPAGILPAYGRRSASGKRRRSSCSTKGTCLKFPGAFLRARRGNGYCNLAAGEALGGHIRADLIADIAFLSLPFMGWRAIPCSFSTGGEAWRLPCTRGGNITVFCPRCARRSLRFAGK